MATVPAITCPKCKKKFKGKGDLRGKKIRCPFCQDPFVVADDDDSDEAPKPAKTSPKAPAKSANSGPAKAPPPPAPAPLALADDDQEDDGSNPYGVTQLDLAPRCPNCANEMESAEAVICLYCGYNTLTRTWGKTEKVIAHTFGEHLTYLMPALLAAFGIILGIGALVFYCLSLPAIVQGGWLGFLDHESMRLWAVVIILNMLWPAGFYAFNRLVLHPKPPDKVKE